MEYADLWHAARTYREELAGFAAMLVRTPSPSGQEALVADLIRAEMVRLNYDQVWVDQAGNVVGSIRGGGGPSLMLNGHMDHVDAGDPAHWRYPPFEGSIHGGELWGRGSADMKGALASMVYAGGLLKKLGLPLPADLYVSAVVQEEVGGLGARHLAGTLAVERVVVGEASKNDLRRGHRGRVELSVEFEGRSVHASMPHLGANPHFSMARFLSDLQHLEMASDPEYVSSTVAPTSVTAEPRSANVTPASLNLVLDWRNIPCETPREILAKLSKLLSASLLEDCSGKIEVTSKELKSYTGFELVYADVFPSFSTAADHSWLQEARANLEDALERSVGVDTWRFATDGGHFAKAGATVIGFGPGDDTLVHTVEERIPVDELVESLVAYMTLSLM